MGLWTLMVWDGMKKRERRLARTKLEKQRRRTEQLTRKQAEPLGMTAAEETFRLRQEAQVEEGLRQLRQEMGIR